MRARALSAALLALALLPVPAAGEVAQERGVRVALDGELSPKRLPRAGTAPVSVSFSTRVSATRAGVLPQLRSVQIAINRNGRLDRGGLPVCELAEIQPATTAKAMQACRRSLVGRGHFEATVALDRQAAFPTEGEMLAFNGTYRGRPAVLAHVYGTEPVPTSFTLPFVIGSSGKGPFGTTLTAKLPRGEGSYVTGFDLVLHRTYSHRGRRHSFASAGCPAPKGFPGAVFPFARTTYGFAGGKVLTMTLSRACRARG